jgi:hypothetical protein
MGRFYLEGACAIWGKVKARHQAALGQLVVPASLFWGICHIAWQQSRMGADPVYCFSIRQYQVPPEKSWLLWKIFVVVARIATFKPALLPRAVLFTSGANSAR